MILATNQRLDFIEFGLNRNAYATVCVLSWFEDPYILQLLDLMHFVMGTLGLVVFQLCLHQLLLEVVYLDLGLLFVNLLLAECLLIYDGSLLERRTVDVDLGKQRLIIFVHLLSHILLGFFFVFLGRLMFLGRHVFVMIAFINIFLLFCVVGILIFVSFLLSMACVCVRLAV